MQLHDIQSNPSNKSRKRIGRGGKRGNYSGHGIKGQKSRAGARIRPGFRGGDNPIWKLFPKKRGASKKVDIKHRMFLKRSAKPAIINLAIIDKAFEAGTLVSPKLLIKKGLLRSGRHGIKVLADGTISKKLSFEGLLFSKEAIAKITQAGGTINKSRPTAQIP